MRLWISRVLAIGCTIAAVQTSIASKMLSHSHHATVWQCSANDASKNIWQATAKQAINARKAVLHVCHQESIFPSSCTSKGEQLCHLYINNAVHLCIAQLGKTRRIWTETTSTLSSCQAAYAVCHHWHDLLHKPCSVIEQF